MEEEEQATTLFDENNDRDLNDNKKAIRRKLPEKGTEEYKAVRNEEAKKRRSERIDTHKCPHCDYAAPFPNKLRLHIDTKHTPGRFKCDTCIVYFDHHNSLRKHMKEIHPIIYSCTKCQFTSKTRADLVKHVNKIHTNGMKCTVAGCNATLLKKHLKKHLDECHSLESKNLNTTVKINPFIHQCESCVYTTSDFEAFEEHLSKHKNTSSCSFNECEQTIALSELDTHINENHSEDEVYNLPKRESASKEATPSHVDAHLLMEDGDNLSTCADEDRDPNSDIPALDEEITTLTDILAKDEENADEDCEGTFNCILCTGRFRKLIQLKKHTKRVHEKIYKKDPPREKKHKCTFEGCSKSFTTIGLLNDHLNYHNNITPYSCESCNQKFHARARFAVHLSKYHQMSIKSYDDIKRSLA